eukprot:gene9487-11635_t
MEEHMTDLLNRIVAAHGGLDRWAQFNTVQATIVTGGALWAMKGLHQDSDPRETTVWLHQERASVVPFGAPDQRTVFAAAQRVYDYEEASGIWFPTKRRAFTRSTDDRVVEDPLMVSIDLSNFRFA